MDISFIYAGQGAQFAGMGLKEAEVSQAARKIFQEADEVLGYSLSEICFHGSLEDLTSCRVCQPAIYVVSRAMRVVYGENHPEEKASICAGLSLGEFSAACEAGVFDFATGLRLVAERGRLMDLCCQEHPGTMAAVLGCVEEAPLQEICERAGIDIANFNAPGQMVISGQVDGVKAAMEQAEKAGFRCVPLTVAGAYHSRVMEPAAEAFGDVLKSAELSVPKITFLQNVTGGPVSDAEQIRCNLQKQVSSSVRWTECASYITQHSQQCLEFGPGNVLTKLMKRIARGFSAQAPFLQQESPHS